MQRNNIGATSRWPHSPACPAQSHGLPSTRGRGPLSFRSGLAPTTMDSRIARSCAPRRLPRCLSALCFRARRQLAGVALAFGSSQASAPFKCQYDWLETLHRDMGRAMASRNPIVLSPAGRDTLTCRGRIRCAMCSVPNGISLLAFRGATSIHQSAQTWTRNQARPAFWRCPSWALCPKLKGNGD